MNELRRETFPDLFETFKTTRPAVRPAPAAAPVRLSESKPELYAFIFGAWVLSLVWFGPRLIQLLDIADTWYGRAAIGFFITFTALAWLYALYNVGVILFAAVFRKRYREKYLVDAEMPAEQPAVALLYTTRNDFRKESVISCVQQNYANFTVYILDDSTDPTYQRRIDAFASGHERVTVVRRPDRVGFKAGNINHGLRDGTSGEPFFAIADADEILPSDFLTRTLRRILADDRCGFVQANHASNPNAPTALASAMGPGIDAHWRWYHPLRNRYGFVMLLGHGALLRRRAFEDIGGFPEIVSEDLAFALRIREHGWRGHFAEDITCFEDFPETVRAFRVRHMKWTRGTCEFLWKEMRRVVRSKNISLVEKLDVIFPTINLPLSLFYFLYLIDANLIFASLFGVPNPVTFVLGGSEIVIPTQALDSGFTAIHGFDFFAITLTTLLAPILCFVIEMYRQPGKLVRFLSRSTALYATLGPLSCVGVIFYALTGKAVFHVTADNSAETARRSSSSRLSYTAIKEGVQKFLAGSHPDSRFVQAFEICCGVVFALLCLQMFQVSFFGLAVGFMMFPLLHHMSWENPLVKSVVHLPFAFVAIGLLLGGVSLFGMQTVLFGYGFHF